MRELGRLGGARLDQLARAADRNPAFLHLRNAAGRNLEWIEYHLAYGETEQMAYGDFSIHRMSQVEGVFGWPEAMMDTGITLVRTAITRCLLIWCSLAAALVDCCST